MNFIDAMTQPNFNHQAGKWCQWNSCCKHLIFHCQLAGEHLKSRLLADSKSCCIIWTDGPRSNSDSPFKNSTGPDPSWTQLLGKTQHLQFTNINPFLTRNASSAVKGCVVQERERVTPHLSPQYYADIYDIRSQCCVLCYVWWRYAGSDRGRI